MTRRTAQYAHCKDCRHEWVAFWTPLTLGPAAFALLKAPCPKCLSRRVYCGKYPTKKVKP